MILKEALQRFQKEMNVIHYLRRIRLSASLAHVTLSNFQKDLIPYFNENVLGKKDKP